NIRTHIFLCIIGMIFYRYMAWKCKHVGLSLRGIVEELEGIRVAIVKQKTGRKVEMMMEEMNAKQVRLFYLLDLGEFMDN
ncbi:MAG: IS1634 family transposase, partial [Methanosarcinaceae archaeon]|nr:IS1634 family transposase [Methanosarcinaceae archaeon]